MPLLRASRQSHPLFGRFQERESVLHGALMSWDVQCIHMATQHVVKFVSLFILCLSVVHVGSLKTGQLKPG